LAEALLNAGAEVADVMDVPQAEADRRMLATILLKEDELLTAELLDRAVRALQKIHIKRRVEQVRRELDSSRSGGDDQQRNLLLRELERLSRALRASGLGDGGSAPAA
jgi:hypothetical protein